MKARRRSVALFVSVLLTAAASMSSAHDVGQSYVFLTLSGDEILVRAEMNVGDVDQALGLSLGEDQSVPADEIAPYVKVFEEYVRKHVVIAPDGESVEPEDFRVTLMETSFARFVQVHFSLPLETHPGFIDVRYTGLFEAIPDHVAFLVVENNWLTNTFDNEAEIALTFTAEDTEARLDLSSSSVMTGLLGMIEMGMHHIWIGIDHVLFLVALLLPSVMCRRNGRWEPVPDLRTALVQVVKVVTLFTIAHTITLSMATLQLVQFSPRLVESIIAASIAIVALDILFPVFRGWIYSIVVVFGLFHGFGFASVLAEMPIPDSYVLLSLLGFNIGVEVGQLGIVCVAVPVLYALRSWWFYPKVSMPAGAAFLICISLYWFVERAFEVDLPAGAIVYRIMGWI